MNVSPRTTSVSPTRTPPTSTYAVLYDALLYRRLVVSYPRQTMRVFLTRKSQKLADAIFRPLPPTDVVEYRPYIKCCCGFCGSFFTGPLFFQLPPPAERLPSKVYLCFGLRGE